MTPATQRYKIHRPATFIHEVTMLNIVLAIRELDCRFLHNRGANPGSNCGRLLGLTPAFQRYRLRLCRINTQEFAVFCGESIRFPAGDTLLDGRLLHNRWKDLDSVHGRLLGFTPAFQRYKVCLCRIKTQEFAIFCRGSIRFNAGSILLDGRLLHDHLTDLVSVCGGLLGSTPATQRYKVRLCRINTQEFAVFCGESIRYYTGDILLDSGLLHNH